MNCDQCQALMINGIFCHETGCSNSRKTWVPERGEWVLFLKCCVCGFDVEEGTFCGCCEETGGESEEPVRECSNCGVVLESFEEDDLCEECERTEDEEN